MKKVTLLAFGIFMVFQFFAMANSAWAQSCVSQGGICADATSCVTGYYPITGSGCPAGTIGSVCCHINSTTTTCTGQGGICAPSCASGFTPITGSGCPSTTDQCCVGETVVPTGTSGSTINFANPLAFNTVEGLLAKVMATFQGMIVVLCLIFFIWAAIVYITSAGSEERVKSAKSGMTAALIGLALGIAAPSILKTLSVILGWNGEQSALAGALTFSQIALKVLDFLLGAVGVLGIIMFIVGGVMYFGAAADEENVKAAKRTIKYAIMGIALALGSMVIVRQIAALLT